MVCSQFSPNPFKKDICKNCQKSKSLHANVSVMVSALPPCSNFKANPFKQDLCVTCQQSKHLHSEDRRVNPNTVQISSFEETNLAACNEYREHAFKQDICLNCGKKKESHSFLRSTVARYVDPVSISPREKLTKAFEEKSVPNCDSSEDVVLGKKTIIANELYQNTFTENLDVSQKQESSTTVCSDFREHAFKRNYCANCGKVRESHEGLLQKSCVSVDTEKCGVGKPPCNLKNAAEATCVQLFSTETILPEVISNAVSEDPSFGDDKKGEKEIQEAPTVVCSDFREHAFRRNYCVNCGKVKESHNNAAEVSHAAQQDSIADIGFNDDVNSERVKKNNVATVKKSPLRLPPKVPLTKTADDEKSSESETIVKKSPLRLPSKVPLTKTADDEKSSESESETIMKKSPLRLPSKVPLTKTADDEKSSESESETIVKKSPLRLPPKVPLEKTADDEKSSESESETIMKKSPLRLLSKVPLTKTADDEKSSESESETIMKKSPLRLPSKVPLTKTADDEKSSESESESATIMKKSPLRLLSKVPLEKTADDEKSSESESETIMKEGCVHILPLSSSSGLEQGHGEVTVNQTTTGIGLFDPAKREHYDKFRLDGRSLGSDENADSELILSTNSQKTRVPKDLFE